MNDVVLVQWSVFLNNLSTRERDIGFLQKGTEFAWIQFFKDVMKFYRLIFRLRFHRCDKRNDDNQQSLVETIIYELGFKQWDYDLEEVFQFFYPVLDKLRKTSKVKQGPKFKSFTLIYESYSEENLQIFISNGLSRQLLAFFILNYSETYQKKMEGSFKEEVKDIISKWIFSIHSLS